MRLCQWLAALLLLTFGSHGIATVVVPPPTTGTRFYQVEGNSVDGWVVRIQALGSPSVNLTLYTTTPGENIREVIVTPINPSPIPGEFHTITLTFAAPTSTASIQNLMKISNDNPSLGSLVIANLHVNGMLGDPSIPIAQRSIEAEKIVTLRAGGDIGATIRSTGRLASNGSLVLDGEITSIVSDTGSITGDIYSKRGIRELSALNGTIGSSSRTSSIVTGNYVIMVNGQPVDQGIGIGEMKAGTIFANVNTVSEGGFGRVCRVVADGSPAPGNFTGDIITSDLGTLYNLDSYIQVAGNLNADVTFRYTMSDEDGPALPAAINIGGELPANKTIRVGLSMEGGNTGVGGIKVNAAGGLKGQVMVNAQNGNPATYPWLGDVTVGSTLLDPGATGSTPYYPTLSSTLGGGAVGLVPFNLHKQDCLPIHDAGACSYPSRVWTSCGGGAARDTLILRHYGPIEDSDRFDSDLPVKVERQSLIWNCYYNQNGVWQCDPAPWEDVSTQVDVCVAPSEGGTPRPRELWIARKIIGGVAQPWWGGYQIRVTLMPNDTNPDLRSAGTLASTAPIIAGYPYRFATICDEPFGLSAGAGPTTTSLLGAHRQPISTTTASPTHPTSHSS